MLQFFLPTRMLRSEVLYIFWYIIAGDQFKTYLSHLAALYSLRIRMSSVTIHTQSTVSLLGLGKSNGFSYH